MSDNNSILAPNPDSIKPTLTNTIKKVYTTKAGDTLNSIAGANGVSVSSIIWSNPQLTGGGIAPGWDLIIPPSDGVVVTADANTTLPDLAAKYNPEKYNTNKQARDDAAAKLLNTIITYNGLDSAEDINDGDVIFVPGGQLATPPPAPTPKPKPKTKTPAPDNSINDVTSIGSGYDGVNHYFPRGYCTYYVASQMKITFGGNAKSWLANAKASGYVTGTEPAPRSAVVMTGPRGAMRRYGHVAYVDSVNGDGTITVSEMNYDHFNRVDTRTISARDSSIRGYIYP
jgi:surface antigen